MNIPLRLLKAFNKQTANTRKALEAFLVMGNATEARAKRLRESFPAKKSNSRSTFFSNPCKTCNMLGALCARYMNGRAWRLAD